MSANLLFTLGTLGSWVSFALLVWAACSGASRKSGVLAGIAGLLLVAASATPAFSKGIGIPLIWPSIPFAAWAIAVCVLGVGLRLASGKFISSGIWLVAAVAFVLLYRLDPQNKLEMLRGWIGLSIVDILAIVALLFASAIAMITIGSQMKALARQVALLAGCVIFGAPFLWLLITSFKEDRDMASPNGIVWIPRVQQTVPYLDPTDPLLEGRYKGMTVEGTSIGRTSDGGYIVSIERPSRVSGISFTAQKAELKEVPKDAPVVQAPGITGFVVKEHDDGRRTVQLLTPLTLEGTERTYLSSDLQPVRSIGLRTKNYTDAMESLPPETQLGFVYLKNTLILVVLSVIGTLLSSSLVAFGFARIEFPGRDLLFKVLLATMMLPAAVTLVPQFLLFRSLGWIDTLLPLWVPAFFASAFNVFLLRQFFSQIPKEFEDAGKIDGAGILRTFWTILLPQIKPSLAVVAIWTFIGAWNNFMGPLIYIDSPENMPLAYAVQLFQGERGGEPGLMMAFATLTTLPVIAVFFFAQRYFIEGVSLSGLGGR